MKLNDKERNERNLIKKAKKIRPEFVEIVTAGVELGVLRTEKSVEDICNLSSIFEAERKVRSLYDKLVA